MHTRHLPVLLALPLVLACALPATSLAQGGALIGGTREDPYEEEEAKESEQDAPARLRRTEYVSGGPLFYVTSTGYAGGGIQLRLLTLKWRRLVFSCLEAGIGGDANEDSMVAHIGSLLGYRFYLGSGWQHQLRPGVGLAFGTVFSRAALQNTDGSSGLYMLPGVTYLYEFPMGLHIGGSFGLVMPLIVGDFKPYVMALSFGVTVGY